MASSSPLEDILEVASKELHETEREMLEVVLQNPNVVTTLHRYLSSPAVFKRNVFRHLANSSMSGITQRAPRRNARAHTHTRTHAQSWILLLFVESYLRWAVRNQLEQRNWTQAALCRELCLNEGNFSTWLKDKASNRAMCLRVKTWLEAVFNNDNNKENDADLGLMIEQLSTCSLLSYAVQVLIVDLLGLNGASCWQVTEQLYGLPPQEMTELKIEGDTLVEAFQFFKPFARKRAETLLDFLHSKSTTNSDRRLAQFKNNVLRLGKPPASTKWQVVKTVHNGVKLSLLDGSLPSAVTTTTSSSPSIRATPAIVEFFLTPKEPKKQL